MNRKPHVRFALATLASYSIIQAASFAQAPPNDNFATPTVISGDLSVAPLSATGVTFDATKEALEPNHALNAGGASIWFQWVAQTSGPVSIDLLGSDFDTTLGIYVGTQVENLVQVIFNDDGDDDSGVGVPSKAVFNAVAGTGYRIAVDGYNDGVNPVLTGNVLVMVSRAQPPANDAFASPVDLGSTLPTASAPIAQRDATLEDGEPPHGGLFGFGSTWYTWTADDDGAVQISIENGVANPSLVAVYTGNSLGGLTEVGTALSGASLLVPTSAGTTYRIAAVGLYAGGAQTRGNAVIIIGPADAIPVANFDFGQTWQWLHPLNAVDPAIADADFNTTWQTQGPGYNGPVFQPFSPAPLGYGAIVAANLVTDIGTPASGSRFSAYFFRRFTLAAPIAEALVEILADDGAIIYLDGVEVGRLNVTGADAYALLADDAAGTEERTYRVRIGSIPAGAHTIGVSLHNATVDSSDLGFDLRLLEGVRSNGDVALGAQPLCTGFQDPAVGSGSYFGRSNGNELGWSATAGVTIAVPPTEQAFEISALSGVRLETERISVAGNAALVASFDFRSVDTSSGFEDTDFLHVFVEGSYDGLTFANVADIFLLTGGDPVDPFESYRSDSDYFSFTTQVGDIPAGLASVRLVVEATANSTSEHLILDNLCLTTGATPIRLLAFSATRAGGASLTIQAEPGHLYEFQSSPDLGATSGWQFVSSEVAEAAELTFTLDGPLSESELFFRVVDLGED